MYSREHSTLIFYVIYLWCDINFFLSDYRFNARYPIIVTLPFTPITREFLSFGGAEGKFIHFPFTNNALWAEGKEISKPAP